jgi:hypothetical protein
LRNGSRAGDGKIRVQRRPEFFMPEDSQSDGHGRRLAWLAVIAVLAPIFYVLSIGPVCWTLGQFNALNSPWAESVFKPIYAPLIWLADHNLAFYKFLCSYLLLFGIR